MEATKVRRLSGCIVWMGYAFLLPGLAILARVLYFGYILNPFIAKEQPALVRGIIGGIEGVGLLAAIPFLLAGFLLTMKKKVWKCSRCGYIFDKA
jgi:hypothetical protein